MAYNAQGEAPVTIAEKLSSAGFDYTPVVIGKRVLLKVVPGMRLAELWALVGDMIVSCSPDGSVFVKAK